MPDMFIGSSEAARKVREKIEVAASCVLPVLIMGETGAGKEVVARAIHALSPRGANPGTVRIRVGETPISP